MPKVSHWGMVDSRHNQCSRDPRTKCRTAVLAVQVLQSVALCLVLRQAEDKKALALPLTAFGAHLALGNWWNVVFFGGGTPAVACWRGGTPAVACRRSWCLAAAQTWRRTGALACLLHGKIGHQMRLQHDALAPFLLAGCGQRAAGSAAAAHASGGGTAHPCLGGAAARCRQAQAQGEHAVGAFWLSIAGGLAWCRAGRRGEFGCTGSRRLRRQMACRAGSSLRDSESHSLALGRRHDCGVPARQPCGSSPDGAHAAVGHCRRQTQLGHRQAQPRQEGGLTDGERAAGSW